MITARTTRLVRVPDLHDFRRAIQVIARSCQMPPHAIVVPGRSAARQLEKQLAKSVSLLLTREQLYDSLHARMSNPPRRLSIFERDSIAQAAAAEAARAVPDLSFRLRPGLVVEMLRFYDQLRRQSQKVRRFEELTVDALGGEAAADDRGAARMMLQTRFLAHAFHDYERRVAESGAVDEHLLRDRLLSEPAPDAIRHITVTVADWIADPDGLFVADFDLLARLPGLEHLDIIATDATLNSGFDERIHNWWPGLQDVAATELMDAAPRVRPVLLRPADESSEALWFTLRDREEELLAIARRVAGASPPHEDSTAVVFKHPLPYLYLAPSAFGAAGIPYEASDALPLAAEPVAAAVDLVLELAETTFVRSALVAILRSPHFSFADTGQEVSREAVSAFDVALSEARYLGDLRQLETLAGEWTNVDRRTPAMPALNAALRLGRELTPLLEPSPASSQLRRLIGFLETHWRPLEDGAPFSSRERRAGAAVRSLLMVLADAHAAHHDPHWSVDDLAGSVRRWIGEETFVAEAQAGGVQLLDDRAARYGEFRRLALVGLVENEWPERPRTNIFYPAAMLSALGWPSEKDRRGAADARFVDLLSSASHDVSVSTFTLDDDAIVMRSAQLDEIPRAGLSSMALSSDSERPLRFETVVPEGPSSEDVSKQSADWLRMRLERPPHDTPAFHGSIGPQPRREWSVSALETYLGCPFKFFALHVLKLAEEPDDEEVMDPRRQGQLVHEVFELFFRRWQMAGYGAITSANISAARDLFETVVDDSLARLPEAEAGLERTRLLGSSAAAGLGEAVFRMEAERPVAVVERLLEHTLNGSFTISSPDGARTVSLRGKADRLDLLEDGSFRLIDYKLGWPPNRSRALQLPIYGLCAEERLANYRGRSWRLGEAMYLAFKGPKRVVPLFANSADRDKTLGDAQARLAATIDAIERGEFPPTPDDVYRCETCSMSSVCRKDYVGDVRT